MTVYVSGTARVTAPQGSHLQLVIKGEEATPVDLLELSAGLLQAAGSSASPTVDADEAIDFATLTCSDDVVFELDNSVIDNDAALNMIAGSVLGAILAATA